VRVPPSFTRCLHFTKKKGELSIGRTNRKERREGKMELRATLGKKVTGNRLTVPCSKGEKKRIQAGRGVLIHFERKGVT